MGRDSRFGTGIVWGTIPIEFPVSWVAVPGCSRNDYGTSPNLWVQKKFVKLWQSTQNTRLCPTKFFWEFFSYPPFDLFKNLGDVFLSHFWIKRVLRLTVPGIFRCFSRDCCYISLIPQSCHGTRGKVLSAVTNELKFLFFFANSDNLLFLVREKSFNECKH